MSIRIISAGAGSGKTFRVAEELRKRVSGEGERKIRPDGIIATTFTVKAAEELRSRVREFLHEYDLHEEALHLDHSLIGTVNGICGRLLETFSFEAELSPELQVIAESDAEMLFHEAVADVLARPEAEEISRIAGRFSGEKNKGYEWRGDLRRICDLVRNNRMDTQRLADDATFSIAAFREHLPASDETSTDLEWDERMLAALEVSLKRLSENMESGLDTTKDTRETLYRYRKYAATLRRGETLRWEDWRYLSGGKIGAKSREAIAEVQGIAGRLLEHPRFKSDMEGMIRGIMSLAALAVDAFQDFKRKRGLIDFIDQEILALKLLDRPEVADRIKAEFDILIVDEFQDTSPVQLELFLRLSALVPETIWVGDPKQAIYEFRGADPELMQAAIDKLGEYSAEDIQTTSYRSRPELVSFANAIFGAAFAEKMPRERIVLQANRKDDAQHGTGLRQWMLENMDGKRIPSAKNQAKAIASALQVFLKDPPHILDRRTKKMRRTRSGDIALLFYKHEHCEDAAAALKAAGIASVRPRPGLTASAEGVLARAVIRWLLYSSDTLAAAEIALLTSAQPDTAVMLQERLDYLEGGGASNTWDTTHPIFAKIEALRPEVERLGPAELLDQIVATLDLPRILARFGEAERRRANLEVLRGMARAYEERCLLYGAAATPGGYLLYLDELATDGKDSLAADGGPDAIRISTYHGAKGLEWPIVVSGSLTRDTKPKAWGVHVLPAEKFDPGHPLAGRRILYWPQPSQHFSGIARVKEHFERDANAQRIMAARLEEMIRLMYVGFTRSRDYQILATVKGKMAWMELTFASGNIAMEIPKETGRANWNIGADSLSLLTEIWRPEEPGKATPAAIDYFPERPGAVERPLLIISPSSFTRKSASGARIGAVIDYGHRIDGTGKYAMKDIGTMLHAFLAVARPEFDDDRLGELYARISANHLMPDCIAARDVIAQLRAFYTSLAPMLKGKQLESSALSCETPIRYLRDGQIVSGEADLILRTEMGYTLIDHKSFPGKRSELEDRALSFAGQLKAYKDGIEQAMPDAVENCYLNFFMLGSMVEVELD